MQTICIGMKVRFKHGTPSSTLVAGQVYTVRQYDVNKGILWLNGGSCPYVIADFEEVTSFTKSNLRTGMRVKYANGEMRVVAGNALLFSDGGRAADLSGYNEDMTSLSLVMASSTTIVEVYAAPEKCEDFFDVDVKGNLLYTRVEVAKTKEELIKRAVLKEIAVLEDRLANLKAVVGASPCTTELRL